MHYLWRVDAGGHERLRQFEGHGGMVGLLAFSKDGKRLATCARGEAPAALLWDVENGTLLQRFVGHQLRINAVDTSPDGRTVATASSDSTVRLWDAEDGTELRRFESHTSNVYCVKYIDGGNRLVTASADGTVRFHDLTASDRPEQVTQKQLHSQTGLMLDGDHIRPIPKHVLWHIEKPQG